MMKLRNWICLGLVILVQSCIPSLHPLYTPETTVFENAIMGTWAGEDQTYIFEKGKGKSYLLNCISNDEVTKYEVHLVKLGLNHFLDFYAYEPDNILSEDDGIAPKIRTHTFAKISWGHNSLEIRHFAEVEWLEQLFDQRKIRIKHEIVGDDIVLTAGPKELQKFFLKYADDPHVFTEVLPLKRAL